MDDPGSPNRVNLDLLRLIPPDAGTVLEVGCGAGALARAYRQLNPPVLYLGIEKASDLASVALDTGGVNRVVVGDVETAGLEDLGLSAETPSVDCLIFDDVLEHLVDPWNTLVRLTQWVRPGGQILACVPNVQHYSVIVNLLRGNWEYQEVGLLDRGHLRFFTAESLRDLFAQGGALVYEVQPRWWPDSEFDRFRQILAPVLSALGINQSSFSAQAQAVQYIVRAIRATHPPARMLIRSLLGSVIGSEVRIAEPATFLATIPGVRTLEGCNLQFDDLGKAWPGEERVFLQQRIIIPIADHIRLQRALLAERYLIVAEFDDDPDHFAELVSSDYFALRTCHCIQTTTDELAQTLRALNPHVKVFPNQSSMLPPLRARSGVLSRQCPTVFFGALNREADWAPLMPTLNRVLVELSEEVCVRVVYDRLFFNALASQHKTFEPLCSYERYLSLLETADLALLPLAPTRFNQHKSDLKFIECAARGVAALASTTVYGHTIKHGETGLVYSSLEEFESSLRRLIQDVPFRRRLVQNAYDYVAQNRLLARHYRNRHLWYRQMLERWDELTAAIYQRVPALEERRT
jgi:SAM-dependent methyltransferase